MGRILPSASQVFQQEENSLRRFRRALGREDQTAFDDLMNLAHKHLSAASYAGDLLPFEILLLAMLIEEHKKIMCLKGVIEILGEDEDGT